MSRWRLLGGRLLGFTVLGLIAWWLFSAGIPVYWGPSVSPETYRAGQELFVRDWQPDDPLTQGDGLGPVYNASSCVECHFQGGIGGGGDNQHNVTAFSVVPTKRDPNPHNGLIHTFARDYTQRETLARVNEIFPIIKGSVTEINGCRYVIPDFNPVSTQKINTPALFGIGWIDRISAKAIRHNRDSRILSQSAREIAGKFKSVPIGRARMLADGRIGKFGAKAQFATVREFVAAACANELGLGNPLMAQAEPLGYEPTTAIARDLSEKQFNQLTQFVQAIPRPREIVPKSAKERTQVELGRKLFAQIGCAACHIPNLNGVKGLYSDLLLYRMGLPGNDATYGGSADQNKLLLVVNPESDEWRTPPLWGVADSAPYLHDGRAPTLHQAILQHHGDGRKVRDAYKSLGDNRKAIIAFLKTLRAPAAITPKAPPQNPRSAPSVIQEVKSSDKAGKSDQGERG